MKVIYTFTLNGDLSSTTKGYNDLRLIAYMLYNEIYNYDGEGSTPLNINDNIEYNNLNDVSALGEYKFDSDLYDDGYIDYEPFIVGDCIFGLTIYDETFNIDILKELLTQTLNLLNLDYNITIHSFPYEAKDRKDEKNRDNTIRNIFDKFGYKCNRKNKLSQIIMHSSNKRKFKNKGRRIATY